MESYCKLMKAITTATGRKEAEIVRDAIAQYLGKTDPTSLCGVCFSKSE